MLVALALSMLAGCGSSPPSEVPGAPTRPPDEAYETGGGFAYRVLVWKCDARHERVVMYQACGEGLTGCDDWQVSRTLCPAGDAAARDAVRTPFEEQQAERLARERGPIPEGHGWR